MRSLADFLAVPDYETKQTRADAPEQRASLRKLGPIALFREILSSPEYLESVYLRIKSGDIPAQIEASWYHYAFGKPVEKTEFKDTTNKLEGMSLDQLEARSHLLQARIQQLRAAKEEQAEGSIH